MGRSEDDFIAALTEIEDSCRSDGRWDMELATLELNKMVDSGRLTEGESKQVIQYARNSKPRIEGKWRKRRCILAVVMFLMLMLVSVAVVSLLEVRMLITPFVAVIIALGTFLVSFTIAHVVIESRVNKNLG